MSQPSILILQCIVIKFFQVGVYFFWLILELFPFFNLGIYIFFPFLLVASSTSAPMTRLMDKRKDVSPVLEGEGPQRNLVVDPLERKIKCKI